jgi:cbb3-type cytochrome oxidase maturation protein
MSVIIVLIGFSLLVAIVFLAAFIWSVKSGQYEDDYTPSVRILFDDEKPKNNTSDLASDPSTSETNKSNKS